MSIVPSGLQPERLKPPAYIEGVIASRDRIVGSVTTIWFVIVQPFASVTNTSYVPAVKPDGVCNVS